PEQILEIRQAQNLPTISRLLVYRALPTRIAGSRTAGRDAGVDRRRLCREEFPVSLRRIAPGAAPSLHNARKARARRPGPYHQRRLDPPWHRRHRPAIPATHFLGRTVRPGPASRRCALL